MLDKKIIFPSHIMFQEFDDEAILLDLHTQEHFGLDPVAAMFIAQVKSGISSRKAYENILQTYEVSTEQLENDLNRFIETLLTHKLIEIS